MYQLLSLFMAHVNIPTFTSNHLPCDYFKSAWSHVIIDKDGNTTHDGIQRVCNNVHMFMLLLWRTRLTRGCQRKLWKLCATIMIRYYVLLFVFQDDQVSDVLWYSIADYLSAEDVFCQIPGQMRYHIFVLFASLANALLYGISGIGYFTKPDSKKVTSEVAPQIQAQRRRTFCLLGRPAVKCVHLKIKRASCKWALEWIQCSSIKSFRIGLR